MNEYQHEAARHRPQQQQSPLAHQRGGLLHALRRLFSFGSKSAHTTDVIALDPRLSLTELRELIQPSSPESARSHTLESGEQAIVRWSRSRLEHAPMEYLGSTTDSQNNPIIVAPLFGLRISDSSATADLWFMETAPSGTGTRPYLALALCDPERDYRDRPRGHPGMLFPEERMPATYGFRTINNHGGGRLVMRAAPPESSANPQWYTETALEPHANAKLLRTGDAMLATELDNVSFEKFCRFDTEGRYRKFLPLLGNINGELVHFPAEDLQDNPGAFEHAVLRMGSLSPSMKITFLAGSDGSRLEKTQAPTPTP